MIQPVWCTAIPARSGFVMAVETHPAGETQRLLCFLLTLPVNTLLNELREYHFTGALSSQQECSIQ